VERSHPKSYFIDMDGVLMRGAAPIPGAADFVGRLEERGAKFLLLTNNSMYTPRALQLRLEHSGLRVPTDSIYTSAMATARFLQSQDPDGTAYAIGESGLTTALHDAGYTLTDVDPRYVVLGETASYSFEAIAKATRLVAAGARFVATNPDVAGPSEAGIIPATGSVGGPDLERGRGAPLLCWQAQPADDAHGPQRHRRALRGLGDDRGQHGHRHNHGPRERLGDGPGPLGSHPGTPTSGVTPTDRPASWSRSPR
jgi:hypothetical protein